MYLATVNQTVGWTTEVWNYGFKKLWVPYMANYGQIVLLLKAFAYHNAGAVFEIFKIVKRLLNWSLEVIFICCNHVT